MKKAILLFFTFFIATGVFAQYNNLKALGDKAFKSANYFQAAYYYKLATDQINQGGSIPFFSNGKNAKGKNEVVYIWFQLAESYRLYNQYENASVWYQKILTGKYESAYPLTRLWYGQCLRAESRFDDALNQLRQFKNGWNGDKQFIALADKEIANCNFAKEQYSAPRLVKITKMDSRLNADAGDYALTKAAGDYWFTSSRLNNKAHLTNIYSAAAASSSNPVIINFNRDSTISNMEYGTPSVAPSGRKMYLTAWYKKGDKKILNIYSSELKNKVWSRFQKINSNVNLEGYNALQPFVTSDGKRLFFSSDRPGGQGGYDIWVSDLDSDGNPVNAVNLGKTINTPADDESPYYDNNHKKLVYSSKGFTGLGGFDFFESYEGDGNWSAPRNLGYPVNSAKDDLYYFEDPDNPLKFYISSDRESDCCLNLFEVTYLPVSIAGSVILCDVNSPGQGITVSLIDSVSKQTIKQQETGVDGRYNFQADSKRNYQLKIEKSGYLTKVISLSAKSPADTLMRADVCLQKIILNKSYSLNNIFYDFGKADLRPESKIALDSLAAVMENNRQLKVQLACYTDSIGSDAYNLTLSQLRAQACVDYILSKGINDDRIYAKGYGKARPVAPNSLPNGQDNPAGRQLNRRTEFTFINK